MKFTYPDDTPYFQPKMAGNHCFGCGAWNDKGLRIMSRWDGEESVCEFTPGPHQAAMPPDVMNGGTIAAVIDCHSVCTAIADAYRRAGREIGEGETLWYATGWLKVNYRKPTPVAGPVTVRTRITRVEGKKTFMSSVLTSFEGKITADGEVLAVQVPPQWADPSGLLKHLR